MALKNLTFRTPNRVLINTGHKTFDSQCDLLMTGNVICNVQRSSYIRPMSQSECNGAIFARGHLFEFDIKAFRPDLPRWIEDRLRKLDTTAILYEIRHWHGRNKKHVHGYIVTDAQHKPILISTTGSQPFKSEQVMSTVVPYLVDAA